ncbi:MAG: rRNA (adenine1518-N6/adenine1519-N6)-dimethyltransferase [Epulopiscium sp.]|uniref:Ribosomal RNA small subunit methyltransferase A n=1 Tax=Defluviitalea raffinosedens TaxID=1450156 RepID=A0A7C8HD10_9FIRM|nr:16S rRNA (adenine(1518)-N(6)/adenine(1519)-N(6))-dimethyltransferase RsmA [Defluviitalea raffinosedens]KAE9628753.1 16S rRNA (adenine(1518)-N(6)/adenine(1519)-N(6))-dimethyltransferase RsmA [Defluviitalea raffinosedens]MDK2787981.1 rRNA (adenine1518-N6/adenine1519-N6)-dimethyltransferase [Candidatus Epulonipiscium sp.]
MDLIASPSKTKEILSKYPFVFRKKYGQNFLIDSHVLNKIIKGAQITEEDCVLEIGPGIGSLTQVLSFQAKKVIAVEIDDQLIPILNDTLGQYDNIKIIHGDILKIDLKKLIEEENSNQPIKVVANLPYYITTPIIMELLESKLPVKSITIMVQKEVAQRLAASPGSKDYGAISVAVQYYSKPCLLANVPHNCFIPRPNVDSAVIHLEVLNEPTVSVKDEALFFKIIKAAFSQRRKTLINSLYNQNVISISKEEMASILSRVGLDENIRGEVLSIDEFAKLSDALSEYLK